MRIAVFAYACTPGKGSEHESGWMWSRLAARLGETWVFTRPCNRAAIETALSEIPERDRLHFVYVDLPGLARAPAVAGLRLRYLLWQVAALRAARRLRRSSGIDVVWHVSYANAWLGSTAALVGCRFVYGPVGGGVRPPLRLVPQLGLRGALYELARESARSLGRYANPLARVSWRRADVILVENQETLDWLPRRHRSKAKLSARPIIDGFPSAVARRAGEPRTALFVGRLLPWKGASLALRAIALVPQWRLLVCGTGPDERRLRRLAAQLGISERVEFLGWRERQHVLSLMREEANAVVLPSLHDEGGWVVVEALACGAQPVVLGVGGPRLLAASGGIAVRPEGSVSRVVLRLAAAIESAAGTAERPIDSDEFLLVNRVNEIAALFPELQRRPAGGPLVAGEVGSRQQRAESMEAVSP